MSKLMEDRLIEDRVQNAVQIAVKMLMKEKYSYDEITEISGLSLSDIEDIARQLKEEPQQ